MLETDALLELKWWWAGMAPGCHGLGTWRKRSIGCLYNR